MQGVTVHDILNYLSELFDKGSSFSHIKAVKAAIGQEVILEPFSKIGDHPLIKKFMTGLFNLRPPQQKTSFVWDVKVLFDYFKNLPTNAQLLDRDLTHKLVMLLLILGGQRVNTILNFHVNYMVVNDIGVTFAPHRVLKHSKKNTKLDTFQYRNYVHDEKLCVVNCLRTYLDRRKNKVSDGITSLLITYKKPYRAATSDTIRRWVKTTLNLAGIYDFSAHSCRSASTSKAKALNIDMDVILRKACWKSEETFRIYYEKDICRDSTEDRFNKLLE